MEKELEKRVQERAKKRAQERVHGNHLKRNHLEEEPSSKANTLQCTQKFSLV